MTFISITCAGKTALSLAGGKDEGVYAAQATYDPSDPADQSNPKVQRLRAAGRGRRGSTRTRSRAASRPPGGASARSSPRRSSRPTPSIGPRLMNTLFSLDVPAFGLLRDDDHDQDRRRRGPVGHRGPPRGRSARARAGSRRRPMVRTSTESPTRSGRSDLTPTDRPGTRPDRSGAGAGGTGRFACAGARLIRWIGSRVGYRASSRDGTARWPP